MDYFSPLLGQPQAIELLTQGVLQNRVPPAYLFAGTNGIGRSLAARCYLELLLCHNAANPSLVQHKLRQENHPDVLWIQPSYQHQGQIYTAKEAEEKGLKRKTPPSIRLEQIRGITNFVSRPPLEASRSVVIIEDAQTMAESAANALLKTLEEPGQATLILIAPSPDSILSTLVSRCQKIPFYRLDKETIKKVLRKTGNEEILENKAILDLAAGSPGEAIASYKQLQQISPELLKSATQLPKSPRQALELGKQIDKELNSEAQFWLINYLQQHYWQQYRQPKVVELLEKARKNLLIFAQPRLVWECTFLEMLS
jgi:DNA polymerase-3 subunit delta'